MMRRASLEDAAIWAADPFIGIEQALHVALDAETAGFDRYNDTIGHNKVNKIQVIARDREIMDGLVLC